MEQQLKDLFWQNPTDNEVLRVWADSLTERGDPRGEFILLNLLQQQPEGLTPDQSKRLKTLRNAKGKLVGPAHEFLREWEFTDQGLIGSAVCDAPKLAPGFAHIAGLHPRLRLRVESLRTKTETAAAFAAFATLPLKQIYYLYLDGKGVCDATLARLGPGLRGVRNLCLAAHDLSPDGVIALAPYLGELEFLCLSSTRSGNPWADAICDTPAYAKLQAICFAGYCEPDAIQQERLEALPAMRTVWTQSEQPYDAAEIDAAKRGEREAV